MPAVLERALARYRRAVIRTTLRETQGRDATDAKAAEQAAHDEVLAAARPSTTQK